MALKTSKVGKFMVGSDTLTNNASMTLTGTMDTGETTSIGDSIKTYLGLLSSWSVSVSCQYDPLSTVQAALRALFLAGTPDIASIKMYEDGTKYFSGAAVLTSFAVTKGINAIDTLALSFQGSGLLSYT